MHKHIRTAEVAFGGAGDVLTTSGIGSCVVLCLWCEQEQLGAIAHIMLPDSSCLHGEDELRLGICPDVAIPHLLGGLRAKTRQRSIVAKLAGGGNMFSQVTESGVLSETPTLIIRNIRALLSEEKISILAECLGGPHGRKIEFDVTLGTLKVENVIGETKSI